MYSHISDLTFWGGENDLLYAGDRVLIDFTSGIFAANIGHRNPAVTKALHTQADKLQHSYTLRTEIRERYLKRLCDFTGYEAAVMFSSGTEAVEAAWRLAKRYKGREGVWGLTGGFHGKTFGSRIISGSEHDWRNQTPGDKTAALFMEPYTPAMAKFHDDALIGKVKTLVKTFDLFLVADEVQGGFGRTGPLFGFDHYGLKPDFVVIGKGMANGFPASALLGPAEIIDNPVMDLTSTNGGNPLACAAGMAVIDYFEDFDILERAHAKGDILQSGLRKLPCPVEGRGMVAGLIFDTIEQADRLVVTAAGMGLLLVHTHQATVKLGPPLTITDDNLIEGINIIERAIKCTLDT